MRKFIFCSICGLLILSFGSLSAAAKFTGKARVGWIFMDETGSAAVNQPTFNLFNGPIVSLDKFNLSLNNGLKVYGNLDNITLNNRNLRLGMTKPGQFGLSFRNYQYRHYYSNDGSNFVRRRYSQSRFWFKPVKGLKILGSVGQTMRNGTALSFVAPAEISTPNLIDNTNNFGSFGFQYKYDRYYMKSELYLNKYEDDQNIDADRRTLRLICAGSGPFPKRNDIYLNAGYQHYMVNITERQDTLITDAFWGGVQWYGKNNLSLKYSFLFDRSRRTGDLSATDNILHAIYLTRNWISLRGFTIGYRYQSTDDVYDDVSQNGYFVSAWYKPMDELTLKAGYGNEQTSINEGRTLNGEKSRVKLWAGLKYKRPNAGWNLMLKNRTTDNDRYAGWNQDAPVSYLRGTSYSTDYFEMATDFYYESKKIGQITFAYSFIDGDYTNEGGKFAYRENILSGDFESKTFSRFSFNSGVTYILGNRDVDYERTVLKLGCDYNFKNGYFLEFEYSVFNFDNYNDTSLLYTEYYTGNFYRINLIKEF